MQVKKLLRYIMSFIEFVLIALIYIVLFPVPVRYTSAIFGWLARKGGMLTKASGIARTNLKMCFPDATDEERERILQGCWDNLGRMAAELPKLALCTKWFIKKYIRLDESVQAFPKHAIMLGCHFGNFELAAAASRFQGINIHLVYRPANNIFVDWLITYFRMRNAAGVIKKGMAGVKQMLDVLKKKETLGMMVDQKFKEGELLKFFGADAYTTNMPAKLALKTNTPIYVVFFRRTEGVYGEVYAREVRYNDSESPNEIMQRINDELEAEIRKYPEQWFWVHRRWNIDYS